VVFPGPVVAGSVVASSVVVGLITAGLVTVGLVTASPARAGAVRAASVTAVTRVDNGGTVPGNGGNWASDSFTRTATLTGGARVSPDLCGKSAGSCYDFTAVVSDQGTFRSLAGTLAPNQSAPGERVLSTVSGAMTGRAAFGVFYAAAQPDANLVPTVAANTWTAATWPDLFFPKGTMIAGLDLGPWNLTYTAATSCGTQQWRDSSSNGYGDLPFDGNISGCRPR
jgi:hypothetical protein